MIVAKYITRQIRVQYALQVKIGNKKKSSYEWQKAIFSL